MKGHIQCEFNGNNTLHKLLKISPLTDGHLTKFAITLDSAVLFLVFQSYSAFAIDSSEKFFFCSQFQFRYFLHFLCLFHFISPLPFPSLSLALNLVVKLAGCEMLSVWGIQLHSRLCKETISHIVFWNSTESSSAPIVILSQLALCFFFFFVLFLYICNISNTVNWFHQMIFI